MLSTRLSPSSTSSEDTLDHIIPRRKPRVSAEHTLNRVRENQRRHRARQKDHVAALELKLAETEKQLAEARAEIAILREQRLTELEFCRHDIAAVSVSEQDLPTRVSSIESKDFSTTPSRQEPVTQINVPFSYLGAPNVTYLPNPISPGFIIELDNIIPDSTPASTPAPTFTGPPPCCTDITLITPPPSTSTDPECSTCKTRPPPSPSESTTLCAQAFILISQQNFRNLDPGTIRMWLAQGLRRAQREGEGCRVENGALMRLLDYISGI